MKKTALIALLCLAGAATQARALDRLCDPANEDCRAILLGYIQRETVGIDVGFWFMEDARYTAELTRAFNRGVRIRVLVDPRANASNKHNAARLAELQDARIPMRKIVAEGILHYKMMLFAGQGIVEFSGANYSADAFVYTGDQPYHNYVDEAIYFTDDSSIVQSFMTKFDSLWVDTVRYANYANVSGELARAYPVYPLDPDLNFPPADSFANASVFRYNHEHQQIDVIMYRITDQRHTNAIINAHNRGVPVRLISDPQQYRDASRLWHSWNIDLLYMAGIPVRMRAHAGLNHQKLVLLHGSSLSIFGSSNWTSQSDQLQEEHNYFSPKPEMFEWFRNQFERKWNNSAGVLETAPFTPLPPHDPVIVAPAPGATGVPTDSVTLSWYAGPWAHRYDVYLGTSQDNMMPVLVDKNLGPSESPTQYKTARVTGLIPGTTYYWRVVSRTMANMTAVGSTQAFATAGTPPAGGGEPAAGLTKGTPGEGDIILYASDATISGSAWTLTADDLTANGSRLWNPDRGAAKMTTPLTSPASYAELTFTPAAGTAYHLWVRAKADANDYRNDSFFVQFSNAVDAAGNPVYQIGSATAAAVSVEDCNGAGLLGWAWQDDRYCGTSASLYFAGSGPQTVRIQQREDGVSIDEIVLSPIKFATASPGALKNDTTVYLRPSAPPADPPPPIGTGGDTPPPAPEATDIVLYASDGTVAGAAWTLAPDESAAGGARMWNPDRAVPKLTSAAAAPESYVEFTFDAVAGTPYRLWVRARAENDVYTNDSMFLQFSGAVDGSGNPIFRAGSAAAAAYSLEDCNGAGESGWGWQDTTYCGAAGAIYFAATGPQTIRIQQREDGISFDQIVLSPGTYLTASPGALKNDSVILPKSTTGSEG